MTQYFITLLLLITFFAKCNGYFAVLPQYNVEIPKDQIVDLNLQYVRGWDYGIGSVFYPEEIIEIILQHPNVQRLDVSGQSNLNPQVMQIIHDALPLLTDFTMSGSIQQFGYEQTYYYTEELKLQVITAEMLQQLIQDNSSIERLDLSLSTADDNCLKTIGQGALQLKEINLSGVSEFTDKGLLALVDALPGLEVIDLSKVYFQSFILQNEAYANRVTLETIEKIRERGIIVILNDLTPW